MEVRPLGKRCQANRRNQKEMEFHDEYLLPWLAA